MTQYGLKDTEQTDRLTVYPTILDLEGMETLELYIECDPYDIQAPSVHKTGIIQHPVMIWLYLPIKVRNSKRFCYGQNSENTERMQVKIHIGFEIKVCKSKAGVSVAQQKVLVSSIIYPNLRKDD